MAFENFKQDAATELIYQRYRATYRDVQSPSASRYQSRPTDMSRFQHSHDMIRLNLLQGNSLASPGRTSELRDFAGTIEMQGRGTQTMHQRLPQVLPQNSLQHAQAIGLPTHEIYLLQYWAASRAVARISLATVADRRACRALRATWALHCMAQFGQHDLACCRGCGYYPTYRTCARCHIKWCDACHMWSKLCWKCYRPRHELNDCGEFLPGCGGPGGHGIFE